MRRQKEAALARFFGLSRGVCVGVAIAVAVSPICVQYATHVKQYTVDFDLACLILWLGGLRTRATNR